MKVHAFILVLLASLITKTITVKPIKFPRINYSFDSYFIFFSTVSSQNNYDKVARYEVPLLAKDLYEKVVYIRKNGAHTIELIGDLNSVFKFVDFYFV